MVCPMCIATAATSMAPMIGAAVASVSAISGVVAVKLMNIKPKSKDSSIPIESKPKTKKYIKSDK